MLYFVFRVLRKIKNILQEICDRLEHLYLQNTPSPLAVYNRKPEPWNEHYSAARYELVKNYITNENKLLYFKEEKQLPKGHGIALDERTVEWPWVIAHLNDNDMHILDAGSALNHPLLLSHPAITPSGDGQKQLDIFTLAPEDVCEFHRGISYHFGDLRFLPYKDELFDAIVSVSTLEHVGMDNTMFRADREEHLPEDVKKAFLEIKRVLKRGGKFLFTVPFGVYEDHTLFQQFDANLLECCADTFVPSSREDTFFMYTAEGWSKCSAKECAKLKYATIGEKHPDNAAAARAVACCMWWK